MTVPSTQVTTLLTQFNLTTASEELVPRLTQAGHHDALPVLLEVFEAEAEARRQRRIARLRRASRLPPGKTFETLDAGRLPGPVVQQLKTLASGAFLETATNVLAFGLPGVGKSHALCAVAHALVESGHSVLCVPAYALVQELLGAKRDLDLPRALRKLDLFEVILLDDLGYVQQSPDEAEVLFTLLAERYERRSVMVTSNLVFSQWDRIFRDQMATAAAIESPGTPLGGARVRRAELSNRPVAANVAGAVTTASTSWTAAGSAVAAAPSTVDLLSVPVRNRAGLRRRRPERALGRRRHRQSLPNPLGNSMSSWSRSTAMTASSSSAVAESSNDSGRLSRHVW